MEKKKKCSLHRTVGICHDVKKLTDCYTPTCGFEREFQPAVGSERSTYTGIYRCKNSKLRCCPRVQRKQQVGEREYSVYYVKNFRQNQKE